MTIKYDVGFTYDDMPKPFYNFYRSLPPGFLKFDQAAKKLKQEPYRASLHRNQEKWWIEFPTQEDYLAFILRWS